MEYPECPTVPTFEEVLYRSIWGKPSPACAGEEEQRAAAGIRKAGGSDADVADTIAKMRQVSTDATSVPNYWPWVIGGAVVLGVVLVGRR